MTIVHIVLVKIKPDVKSGNGLGAFQEACHALGTKDEIKALAKEMRWAPPVYNTRTRDYDWGLYSTFADRATYEQYRDHPVHRDFVTKSVLPNTDDLLAYDFEI